MYINIENDAYYIFKPPFNLSSTYNIVFCVLLIHFLEFFHLFDIFRLFLRKSNRNNIANFEVMLRFVLAYLLFGYGRYIWAEKWINVF